MTPPLSIVLLLAAKVATSPHASPSGYAVGVADGFCWAVTCNTAGECHVAAGLTAPTLGQLVTSPAVPWSAWPPEHRAVMERAVGAWWAARRRVVVGEA